MPLRRFISWLLVLALALPVLPAGDALAARGQAASAPASGNSRTSICDRMDVRTTVGADGVPAPDISDDNPLFKDLDKKFDAATQWHAGVPVKSTDDGGRYGKQFSNSGDQQVNGIKEKMEAANTSDAKISSAYVNTQKKFFSQLKAVMKDVCGSAAVSGQVAASVFKQQRDLSAGKSTTCDYSNPQQDSAEASKLYDKRLAILDPQLSLLAANFKKGSEYNDDAIKAQEAADAKAFPSPPDSDDASQRLNHLKLEKDALWGTKQDGAEKNKTGTEDTYDSKSFFGAILNQLDLERSYIKTDKSRMVSTAATLGEMQKRCASTNPLGVAEPRQAKISGKLDETSAAAASQASAPRCPVNIAEGSISGSCTASGCTAAGCPMIGGGTNNPGAPPPPTTPAPGTTPPPGTPTPTPTPTPTATDTSTNFFEEHSTALIVGGVGVAAVGSIIGYKMYTDNKNKKAMEETEAEQLQMTAIQQQNAAASSVTSGSVDASGDSFVGGAPASGQAPVGSTLSVTGIPAGASTGVPVSTILVKIIGPNGVMTQDSATNVTISCTHPDSCPISGTLTVVSQQGTATFSNVIFTAPAQNVTLSFSAPGFGAVTSTNYFDVGN